MTEQEKIEQLEQQIVILKSRVFDANEAAKVVKADNDTLREILTKVVHAAKIETPEDGAVDINVIISTIEKQFAEPKDEE